MKDRLELSYLYGGEIVYQPGETLKQRRLIDFEFVYIMSGEVIHYVNDEAYMAKPGTLILGHEGDTEGYHWDTKQTTRHAYFHFKIENVPSDWPDKTKWPRLRLNPHPLSVSLFRHILNRTYAHTDWPAASPGRCDCLLMETLMDTFLDENIEEEICFERSRPEPVRKAIKWMRQQIDECPNDKFSLDDIASAAGCTPKHLCRLFKNSTGHSPSRTGALMRLQLSLVLLTRTNLNVSQIAVRCGFDNPLYFSRSFSKTFGHSPSAVRTACVNGIPPPSALLPNDIVPRIRW
ncbi:AraC family transcriptional regulator [Rubellicoccus peritrichatus]|uniref:AraC family transcriptional regulator n=1 Tax=Rubellicoccus peritrichatus TaxID=3080537 RepID=A0AAQ3QV79_9BACT|nr:AraC family transcriptional regulator [Puniceicoccus sp. CR14]WOO40635.1 AraC family transcriptional regulator [Puniceicoccus sp. CR14]